MEDSEGFRVGGFSDGVWLWTSPLYLEKENIYIYFLEFEGFSEYETSSIVEEKLMMIAMTLSSTVLIMTNQDYEDDIQKLISLLSFYHENIKLSDENEDIQNFQPPHFFWILREKENFSRKYKLNLDKLSLSKDEESNAIIKTLRNEAEIIWFDNIIRDSINNLREKILRKSQKKEIAGSILTSKIFANLISLMIKNLNENKILEIGKM